eukprot:CAMPEP_0175478542 /NCGR_PEP_ID=MMETSP0095-20121207/76984_1 /TAXON_ID=311494 /ORGANISM="Alexandrium monilatum, Strain CCMP3105" /LENGTH=201 /DNA_ID=CAMNT_0016780139 /DNA_START=144 /DNA_END=747 /DNA_ORIENTATION=+
MSKSARKAPTRAAREYSWHEKPQWRSMPVGGIVPIATARQRQSRSIPFEAGHDARHCHGPGRDAPVLEIITGRRFRFVSGVRRRARARKRPRHDAGVCSERPRRGHLHGSGGSGLLSAPPTPGTGGTKKRAVGDEAGRVGVSTGVRDAEAGDVEGASQNNGGVPAARPAPPRALARAARASGGVPGFGTLPVNVEGLLETL